MAIVNNNDSILSKVHKTVSTKLRNINKSVISILYWVQSVKVYIVMWDNYDIKEFWL